MTKRPTVLPPRRRPLGRARVGPPAPRSRSRPEAPHLPAVRPREIEELTHLRRARDLIDRDFAEPLDVPAMADAAAMSPAHFSRRFREAYGETPSGYLMTRRIERAHDLLRSGHSVTDACMAVGCTSLGPFSSRFTEMTGMTPSAYRALDHRDLEAVPPCVVKTHPHPRRVSTHAGRDRPTESSTPASPATETEQDRRSGHGPPVRTVAR